jgi:hypothetical protein
MGWLPITAIGFWYLGRMGLHLKDMKSAAAGDGRP